MVSFINGHREAHGVEPICAVLPIAPSTCCEQKARQADLGRLLRRAKRDAVLQEHIGRVWEANFQVYGAYKTWRQLNRDFTAARPNQLWAAGLTYVATWRGSSTLRS